MDHSDTPIVNIQESLKLSHDRINSYLTSVMQHFKNSFMGDIKNQNQRDNLSKELGLEQNTSESPDEKWNSYFNDKLKQFVKDVLKEQAGKVANKDKLVKSIQNIMALYPYRNVICEGLVTRNLIVHNKGIMNERNYKFLPLCDLNVVPVLDNALIYNLHYGMHMANDHLYSELSRD